MASPELQTVVEMFRTMNPLASADIQQIRAAMAEAPEYPQPPDVAWEPVAAGGVPSEWTVPDSAPEDRAIVYYHGGGYTIGGVKEHHGLCSNLARAAGTRLLNVGYRLAPEHPYPAAVDDAVSAYRFVLEQGIAPGKIALGGDSAGGGLVLGTLVALRDAGDPLPAAAVCLSPWTDLTLSGDSVASKVEEDPMLTPEVLRVMRDAYLNGADPKSPTASPLFADLSGLPPLLIQVGTAELILDDSLRLAERAKSAGVEVTLEPWEDMIHVWQTFADMLPEGKQAIEVLAAFIREKLS